MRLLCFFRASLLFQIDEVDFLTNADWNEKNGILGQINHSKRVVTVICLHVEGLAKPIKVSISLLGLNPDLALCHPTFTPV